MISKHTNDVTITDTIVDITIPKVASITPLKNLPTCTLFGHGFGGSVNQLFWKCNDITLMLYKHTNHHIL